MSRPLARWCLLALATLALVLVPFALYEEKVLGSIEGMLRPGASRPLLAATVAAVLATDVFVPVPSSLVATGSGMLLGLSLGALATWAGMQAGAMVGYGFGRTLGAVAASRVVGAAELERASKSFDRWGGLSLVASRAVPMLAETTVIAAGTACMPFAKFVWLTAASNAAVALVYAWVGARALETSGFLAAFAASVLLPGALVWGHRQLRRRKNGTASRDARPGSVETGPR